MRTAQAWCQFWPVHVAFKLALPMLMMTRGKVTSQAVCSGGKGAAAVAFSKVRCWNTRTVPGEHQCTAGCATEESQGAAHLQQHQARPGTCAQKVFHVCAVTCIIQLLPWRPDCCHIEVSTTHSIVLCVHLPEVLPRDCGCANCILPPSQKVCMWFSSWPLLPDQPGVDKKGYPGICWE